MKCLVKPEKNSIKTFNLLNEVYEGGDKVTENKNDIRGCFVDLKTHTER